MFNKLAFVLASLLFASVAWAGPPTDMTKGSTTSTVTAAVNGLGMCALSTHMASNDTDAGVVAQAYAQASSYMRIAYGGNVTLDVTRHGNHGAVHEVDLSANAGEGALYAAAGYSRSWAHAVATDSESAHVQEVAQMIASAYANLFQGINFTIDLGVTTIHVKAGTNAYAQAYENAVSVASASAFAYSSAGASSQAVSSAGANGTSGAGAGSSVLVQGANITNFQSQMGLSSGSLTNVHTATLAQTYADAIATAQVYALARASVYAQAKSQVSFTWDLPIIGSGSLPIVTDYDSATKVAQQVLNKSEQIVKLAEGMANSTAGMLINSSVQMNLQAQYENLPGLDDTLSASATGNFNLNCSSAYATATAGTTASTN